MVKTKPSNRQRRKVGNFLAILDVEGVYYFGRELRGGVVAFYDLKMKNIPEVSKIAQTNVLFSVPVMDYAIKNGRWKIIGNYELEENLAKSSNFYMQDVITGSFSIYKEGGQIIPATRSEIEGLECAAVWDPEHIESRLRDHFAGVPNIWFESLKPK